MGKTIFIVTCQRLLDKWVTSKIFMRKSPKQVSINKIIKIFSVFGIIFKLIIIASIVFGSNPLEVNHIGFPDWAHGIGWVSSIIFMKIACYHKPKFGFFMLDR
jgi:hypothetical protein